MLTERQKSILSLLVPEYINRAFPIGSEFLADHGNLALSPATIRSELQELTKEGYLSQPHTSAGRIPTNRGYKFYIEYAVEDEDSHSSKKKKDFFEKVSEAKKNRDIKRSLPKITAEFSDNLAWVFYENTGEFIYEGIEKTIRQPEFSTRDFILEFFDSINRIEDNIGDFCVHMQKKQKKIYVGEEIPLVESEEFSMIPLVFHDEFLGRVVLSIFGPKRMHYDRNLELTKWIKDFFHIYG